MTPLARRFTARRRSSCSNGAAAIRKAAQRAWSRRHWQRKPGWASDDCQQWRLKLPCPSAFHPALVRAVGSGRDPAGDARRSPPVPANFGYTGTPVPPACGSLGTWADAFALPLGSVLPMLAGSSVVAQLPSDTHQVCVSQHIYASRVGAPFQLRRACQGVEQSLLARSRSLTCTGACHETQEGFCDLLVLPSGGISKKSGSQRASIAMTCSKRSSMLSSTSSSMRCKDA